VWTSSGWKKLIRVIKHYTNKKIYRIRTKLGIVDVTEDHSLLNENKKEIKPENLKINVDKLLHHNIYENVGRKYILEDILNSIYNDEAKSILEKKHLLMDSFMEMEVQVFIIINQELNDVVHLIIKIYIY
jgi:hypothetical protein